jgi:predicted transcriptional regulator YheO
MKTPTNRRECELVIETLKHVVEGLGKIVGSNVEVVLHDLSKPGRSVVAIAHGEISGRTIGSPIISGPFDDLGLKKLISGEGREPGETHTLVSGYRTRTRIGRELESTSIILRNSAGEAYSALCVNADRTRLRALQTLVREIAGEADAALPDEAPVEAGSVDSLVQEIIENAIAMTGKPVAMMSKEDKIEAVRQMNNRGLFLIRSSVDMVAESLAVSRFTIYNYLDELKGASPSGKSRRARKSPAAAEG